VLEFVKTMGIEHGNWSLGLEVWNLRIAIENIEITESE